MNEWLTKKQVEKILGISHWTLERLMKAKKITFYKTGTSRNCAVRFKREDVLVYLNSIKNVKTN